MSSSSDVFENLDGGHKDFLSYLNKHGARFLVVGGYAMRFFGAPRAADDLDLWVSAREEVAVTAAVREHTENELPRVLDSIPSFSRRRFQKLPLLVPANTELLINLAKLDFDQVYSKRIETEWQSEKIFVIPRAYLIETKEWAARQEEGGGDPEKAKKHFRDLEFLKGEWRPSD